MRVLLVAHNELAIVTKSIAFACPPTQSGRRGFPFKGERRLGKHVRKGEIVIKVTRRYTIVEEEIAQERA